MMLHTSQIYPYIELFVWRREKQEKKRQINSQNQYYNKDECHKFVHPIPTCQSKFYIRQILLVGGVNI